MVGIGQSDEVFETLTEINAEGICQKARTKSPV